MDEVIESEAKGKLDDDIDALYKLSLAEFIGARNNLAASLKREGRANDAGLVKTLAKPSVSAWAVNQLHWSHREAFNRLLVTGQRFRQALTSDPVTRTADMRESLDARREALSNLSDLATELLRDAGHNPSPDTIHRITTTLEAISVYATISDGPTPGRLTQDVDPPGFESLASLIPPIDTKERNEQATRVTASQDSDSAVTAISQTASPANEVQDVQGVHEETPRARKIAAKASLQEARSSLAEARATSQRLEAALKKAHAEAKEADSEAKLAEKQLREAEERFKKARAASQDAADRAQRIAIEAEEATQAVDAARRSFEKASKEIESLV